MRNTAFQKTLLVLALILGQWLGFAHGLKHVGLAGAEATCEMCLYAQGLDNALLSVPPQHLGFASGTHEAPTLKGIICVAYQRAADHPIRGPPALIA